MNRALPSSRAGRRSGGLFVKAEPRVPRGGTLAWLAIAAGFIGTGLPAPAADYLFNPTSGTANLWGTDTNWTPSIAGGPSGTDVKASFKKVTAATTVDLGSLSPTVNSLAFGSSGTGTGTWTFSATGGGGLTLAGVNPTITNASTLALSAPLSGSNGIIFAGGSIATVSGSNSFTGGVTIQGGKRVAFNSAAALNGNKVTISNGILAMGVGGGSLTIGSDIEADAASSGINATTNGVLTLSGNITGSGGVLYNISTTSRIGVIELLGTNTYLGDTTVNVNLTFHSVQNFGDGKIVFSMTAPTGSAPTPLKLTYASGNATDLTKDSLGNARVVTINDDATIDTGANEVVWSNPVNGNAASQLIKAGTGSLALRGNNQLSGVLVNTGTLIAGNPNATGGSASHVTLGDGAGTDTLDISAGVQLQLNTFTLASSAKLAFHLNGELGATGIAVSGDQIGNGSYAVDIFDGGGFGLGDYTLLNVAGSASAVEFTLGNIPTAFDGSSLNWDGGEGTLTLHVIPEPVAWKLLGLSAGLLYCFRAGKRGRV